MWSWGCKSELSFSHPKSNELCATMMSCYLKAQDHNTFLPSFHKHSHPQHTNTCTHTQHMHTPRRAHNTLTHTPTHICTNTQITFIWLMASMTTGPGWSPSSLTKYTSLARSQTMHVRSCKRRMRPSSNNPHVSKN